MEKCVVSECNYAALGFAIALEGLYAINRAILARGRVLLSRDEFLNGKLIIWISPAELLRAAECRHLELMLQGIVPSKRPPGMIDFARNLGH